MNRIGRLAVALASSVAAAAIVTAGALADGGPSPGISVGGPGITGPGGALRYVAVPTEHGTLVETIRVRDGRVLRWNVFRGLLLGVPLVTGDLTPGGLSRDQRTLILASYAGGPGGAAATHFAVFDTRLFRVTRTITLRGSYSYDALAPDASMLYLVQYTSSRDWTRYRVRAYDLVQDRLLPGAVVDKREPSEAMAGVPVTRVTSADGGWVYTLYARPAGALFIHALDTRHRAAACIDLPWENVAPTAISGVRMSISGSGIVLSQRHVGNLAVVDTRTHGVRSIRSPVTDGMPLG